MILAELNDLYDRIADEPAYNIAPLGYSVQKIAFRVVLTAQGGLVEIQDIRDQSGKSPRPRMMIVPGYAKSPGSGFNPCFLWDNTTYMLGCAPEDKNPKRALKAFQEFRKKHLALEGEIGSSTYSAVCRFLDHWKPTDAEKHPALQENLTGFGVFQIQGTPSYVHEEHVINTWWQAQAQSSTDGPEGQCLITGEHDSIAVTHPKIKGVLGAQSAGAAIVSFNENAYESYGRKQSQNGPVSEQAAFRYTSALNAMLDGPCRDKHTFILGAMTVVFWTDRPSSTIDVLAQFFKSGSSIDEDEAQDEVLLEKLRLFLNALRKGKESYGDIGDDPNETRVFLLGLSPNAARLSIRFFLDKSLSDLLDNLRKHFADIATQGRQPSEKSRGDPEFPPTWKLLAQTARERKEIPPNLAGPLLRSILTGARYPNGLVMAVIRRIHADRTINHARICVLKGYLTRNMGQEVSMSLDTSRTDPAYRLGRLFAALEKTQGDALSGVKATIRDRFYSASSASPRSVFPRLLRTYQHHLAKLEGGRKVNREKLVQEIMDPLTGFPAHLNLADQGVFAIGYYHQMQNFYTKKNDE